MRAAWCEPQLARLHDDAPARLADLAQLREIAVTQATRERFLSEMALDSPAAMSDEAGPPAATTIRVTRSRCGRALAKLH